MLKLFAIEQGKFKLDGGAMFGVVPQQIWKKHNIPDSNNMCTWSMRSMLIHDNDRIILIDTGIGNKQDQKFKSHFEPFGEAYFSDKLASIGYSAEDITDVILTHLHFDHVGGSLYIDDRHHSHPTYPNATYWSNDQHLKWALDPNPRERASFLKENIVPLQEMGILKLLDVEQDIPFSDHISIRFLYGHTQAMMMPIVHLEDGRRVFYTADLLPSMGHMGMPYVMSYDVRPLETMKEKQQFFEDYNEHDLVFFGHDKNIESSTLQRDHRGRMQAKNFGIFEDLLLSNNR